MSDARSQMGGKYAQQAPESAEYQSREATAMQMIRRAIVRYWSYVKDFGVALRPLRFGILGIGIIFVLWLDSYTGQGSDVLIAYSHSAFLGLKSWQFMLALVVFSLVVWLTMYLAILLRFRHGV